LTVASGFELVAEEFERNFSERGELGAAFAVERGGELVVDLWAGVADRQSGRAWEGDTLQLIFSGSKGLVAICLLILIDRGQLDLDREVGAYWPEFAAAGKGEVKVSEVVSHRASLPGFSTPVAVEELTDDARMAALLAVQPRFEDLRLALRRAGPAHRRPLARALLRRGGRRPARARALHRPAGRARAARLAARAGSELGSGRRLRPGRG
jgi:CubicO group peptidase (beta-lactamase class C family)